jgi:hypothetical protein
VVGRLRGAAAGGLSRAQQLASSDDARQVLQQGASTARDAEAAVAGAARRAWQQASAAAARVHGMAARSEAARTGVELADKAAGAVGQGVRSAARALSHQLQAWAGED